MAILIFFIILAVLVLVHELGHFLAAKRAGIKVEEFGFGFPPRLWGWQGRETFYSINWIPFGGFVKILGENASLPGEDPVSDKDRGRTLSDRPRFVQALVLAAGVFFNILLAWFILTCGLWFGLPTSRAGVPEGYQLEKTQLLVVDVLKNSPAALSGLKGGEVITYLSDVNKKISNPTISQIQQFTAGHPSQKITIGYLDDLSADLATSEKQVIVTPQLGLSGDSATIGISLDEVGILKLPFLSAIWQGLRLTGLVMWSIIVALGTLLFGIFHGETAALASITGPVGLVGIVGSSLSLGFSYLLNLVAVISLNLAVINFLPFPALDGGRILFLGIEAVRRKVLSPKFVNTANSAGFFILLGLMALLTYRDIWRLF
jgi:regulator of sigma E protease